MSLTSRVGPDLERYIGTNLISSWTRGNNPRNGGNVRKPEGNGDLKIEGKSDLHKANGDRFRRRDRPAPVPNSGCDCGKNFNPTGRGGTPVVGPPPEGKKKGRHFQNRAQPTGKSEEETGPRTPLSRLAIHTQGAPLILSARCDNARKTRNRGQRGKNHRNDFAQRRSDKYKDENPNGRSGTSDCLSVASDESSGSGHSENCLPRIIKPRKRRKKDRKPAAPLTECPVPEETVSVSGETEKNAETNAEGQHQTEEAPVSEDELHGPKLHHSFEDVTESDPVSYTCSPSSCQCRYCDPSGIWESADSVFSSPETRRPGSFRYVTHSDLALRRSWSEPVPHPSSWWQQDVDRGKTSSTSPHRSNSFSESRSWEQKKSDETRWESLKGCDIDPRSTSDYKDQCLQVSTEIVTSPNGHRDIEIRFYSAPLPV